MSYGCYNRPPFAAAQVLHGHRSDNGHYIKVVVENRMNPECQYQKNDKYADPKCVGCNHKKEQPECAH